MSARHPHLEVTDLGPVRLLRIDRQEALGALSTSLVEALDSELAALENNRAVRTVVLTGTGKGFISGADIKEYANSTAQAFDEYQRYCRSVFERFAALTQVTIAAVNGYAFGGGFELALCADFIIAGDRARFGLPEVKLGLVPGGGGITRLADAGGLRWAKEVMMTGRTVHPEEALERGIVEAVVPTGELLDVAIERARLIAERAPAAIRAIKQLMEDRPPTIELSAAAERAALVALFETRDGREGIRAFVDKRDPVFTDE